MQRNKIEEDIYVFRTNMEAVFSNFENRIIYILNLSVREQKYQQITKKKEKNIYYGGKLRILMTTMIEF